MTKKKENIITKVSWFYENYCVILKIYLSDVEIPD